MRRTFNSLEYQFENSWGFNFSRFNSNGWSNLNLYEASHDPSILPLNTHQAHPPQNHTMNINSLPLINEPPHPSHTLFKCIENENSEQEQIREVSYLVDNEPETKRVNHKQYFRIMKRRIKKVLSRYTSHLVLVPQNLNQNQSGGNNIQTQTQANLHSVNQNNLQSTRVISIENGSKNTPNLIYLTQTHKNYTQFSKNSVNLLGQQTPVKNQNGKKDITSAQSASLKRYKYQSRHKHAKARKRDKNGKFIATRPEQQRFRQKGRRGRKPKNFKADDMAEMVTPNTPFTKVLSTKYEEKKIKQVLN